MKAHYYESPTGLALRVDYEVGPEFHSIHVIDSEYRPVGPDLKEFLHDLVLPTGKRFLSVIAEEIAVCSRT